MADILTPPVVSTLPQGLLRYLGIQSGGKYPQTLGPIIQPEIDIWDLMTINTDVVSTSILALTVTGTVPAPALLVSSSKAVCCSELGFRVVTIAAEAIKLGLVLIAANGGTLTLTDTVTLAASTGDQKSATQAKKVWLQPGDQIGVQVYSITTAGSIACNVHVRKSDFFY